MGNRKRLFEVYKNGKLIESYMEEGGELEIFNSNGIYIYDNGDTEGLQSLFFDFFNVLPAQQPPTLRQCECLCHQLRISADVFKKFHLSVFFVSCESVFSTVPVSGRFVCSVSLSAVLSSLSSFGGFFNSG